MTREQKAQMIDDLQQILVDTDTIYLTDISGLNASETSILRRACFKKDVQLRVVKNTLLKKAMERVEDKEYEELYDVLKGNTAIMISDKENAPAKVIKDFRKKSEKPILKGAWIQAAVYVGDDKVDTLSNLKSKEELIGDVINILQSPMKTVVSQLQSGGQKLSGLVKTLSERSE
ncbi:50S ribosomal protein L10 [Candidatus Ornithobacterium hominis]|uniref:Large ribosomal subunit protein uL10 n=1 Tax=Candidatus Ornithobacterium hominis TaxID=2497989 RepID=A0A383U0N2_9FLAO|nr:50S ribosomal protein L10 [Candidatus Ornithobacterium hominis]MCT7904898.1 50S ribosomal protein L10 [Candidatus Ornithobacterium hominis]SZD73301.1 50S ribosomal protein L10 [Candidatus Ornithobacterium hominis]SZD73404.1 50S ribosomal protein L10 [Candidatus Ornithobacterium hominis]